MACNKNKNSTGIKTWGGLIHLQKINNTSNPAGDNHMNDIDIKNKWVKFLRGFAKVYMLVAFIGGIVYAVNLGRLTGSWAFFLVLIAFWLSIILIVALLMFYTDNIYIRKTTIKSNPLVQDHVDFSEIWQCSCGHENIGRYCKNCGESK